ncbi:MAG: helix-turn-helix transcriptional regulator [Myxococcales bacterium]|nr:helix-turn-helix transcriptional regulator [Myxococcales bacterium]
MTAPSDASWNEITPTLRAKVLARLSGVTIADYCCTAGPRDPAVDEAHGAHSIAIVRSGAFAYRVGASSVPLAPGAVLLGNPGQRFACSHEYTTGDRCLSLTVSDEVVHDVVARSGLRSRGAIFARPSLAAPAATAVWGAALGARLAKQTDALALESCVYRVIAAVIRANSDLSQHRAKPLDVSPVAARRAAEAMLFIEEHAAEPLTLGAIAAAADLSPFHFLRLFRRATGMTPHQCLLRARLRRAGDLLAATTTSVTDVALDAGFADLTNFGRTFRAAAGCAPRAFRSALDGPRERVRKIRRVPREPSR